jgi:hypothetical protein
MRLLTFLIFFVPLSAMAAEIEQKDFMDTALDSQIDACKRVKDAANIWINSEKLNLDPVKKSAYGLVQGSAVGECQCDSPAGKPHRCLVSATVSRQK